MITLHLEGKNLSDLLHQIDSFLGDVRPDAEPDAAPEKPAPAKNNDSPADTEKPAPDVSEDAPAAVENTASSVSMTDARAACTDYMTKHGKKALKAVFSTMGAEGFPDIPAARYGELLERLA